MQRQGVAGHTAYGEVNGEVQVGIRLTDDKKNERRRRRMELDGKGKEENGEEIIRGQGRETMGTAGGRHRRIGEKNEVMALGGEFVSAF